MPGRPPLPVSRGGTDPTPNRAAYTAGLLARPAFHLLLLAVLALAGHGANAAPAPTRAVSLNALQARLKQASAKGDRPDDLRRLCGLTKVSGYLVDEKKRDLILLGEANADAPALHLEDLAVALRNAWMQYATRKGSTRLYASPGCSIDPDPETLRHLSRIAEATRKGSADSMEDLMAQWCDTCARPQKVRVMGVPFDTHFAHVMVDADYLMKRLVDGSLELALPDFASLTDLILALGREQLTQGGPFTIMGLSLNRFWFYPGKAAFEERDGIVTIQRCPVVLLTEQERLTAQGLAGSGKPHPLAHQFAQDLSARYSDIAAEQPIYLELEGLFRFVAVAKLLRYQRASVNLDYLLHGYPVPKTKLAPTLPGIYRVNRIDHEREVAGGREFAQLWLPTCGGVMMGLDIGPHNFKRPPPTTPKPGAKAAGGARKGPIGKKAAVLKARPSPDALYWDLLTAP